jgi:hypothetical protein
MAIDQENKARIVTQPKVKISMLCIFVLKYLFNLATINPIILLKRWFVLRNSRMFIGIIDILTSNNKNISYESICH